MPRSWMGVLPPALRAAGVIACFYGTTAAAFVSVGIPTSRLHPTPSGYKSDLRSAPGVVPAWSSCRRARGAVTAVSYLLDPTAPQSPADDGSSNFNTQDARMATRSSESDDSQPAMSSSRAPSLSTVLEQTDNQSAVQLLLKLATTLEAKKALVWASFVFLGLRLRAFYGIMLGTFVLSYIGSSVVRWSMDRGNKLAERLKLPPLPRRIWALGYISMVVLCIGTLTVLTVPRVVGETNYLSLVIESENPYVFVADGIRKFLGPEVTSKLEAFLLTVAGDEGRSFATGVIAEQANNGNPAESARKAAEALKEVADGAWNQARSSRFAKLLEYSLKGYIKSGFYLCRRLVSQSTALVYKGILSLLFSFMIVWDLPRLVKGARKIRHSRLKFPYEVLAPKIATFGKLVGQSFEVQSMIAVVNTILTTLGLVMLKIPGYGFMSLLVLVTSFIPVFGVFISTLPMALVALTEYGVGKALDVILMVIGIHVVEAYMLSPIIYSATVKLHPVLILSSLYVSEHIAGLQGVFLAVPVTVYIIKQLLNSNDDASFHQADESLEAALASSDQ